MQQLWMMLRRAVPPRALAKSHGALGAVRLVAVPFRCNLPRMATPRTLVGTELGRYRLLEEIGSGGFGVVYRARDLRLERDVALKLLPVGTVGDEASRKRVRQEALSLARLSHPNIATIFDFDSAGDSDFVVLELISGQALDAQLAGGALPAAEAVRLGEQLAEGLAAAHARGVIHRDLKPANIRLTSEGSLKILDFGLAKLLRPAIEDDATRSFTQPEVLAGTLPYIAPEQLRGEKADARSDIWSAGCVLYEMATGRRPFRQELPTALVNEIIHEEPPTPRSLQPRLTAAFEAVILKCLDKAPENRYQSAKELAVDLRRLSAASPVAVGRPSQRRRWVGATVVLLVVLAAGLAWILAGRRERAGEAAAVNSIAVLPLVNSTGNTENEYLSDGITEGLINRLSRLGRLRVMTRTTSFHYKSQAIDPLAAGREMKVRALVTGRLRRRGDELDVQIELVDAADGSQIWGQQYTRASSQLVALQDEISADLSSRLLSRLTGEERERLARRETTVPEAYELYLQGRFHWNKRNPAAVRRALDFFLRASERDPNFALAYAGMADSYMLLGSGMTGTGDPREMMQRAKEAALAALERDDSLAESHATLAYVKAFYDWDWKGSEERFQRALALDQRYASAHQWYALTLTMQSRYDEARRELQQAHELDPYSLIVNALQGWPDYTQRRYRDAIAKGERALELDDGFMMSHFFLGLAYEQEGRWPEAVRHLEQAVEISGGSTEMRWSLAHSYAASGQRERARELLRKLESDAATQYVSPYGVAVIHTTLGEHEQALTWLEKAYAERSPWMVWLKADPRLDPLRKQPRFQQLVAKMALP
jgi:eukaryotic-like serine/threonine-protein kinase